MFCLNCGEQLPEGTKFCTKCGAPVASQPAPSAVDLNKEMQSVPQPSQPFGASTQPMGQSDVQPQQFGAQPQQFGAQPQQFGAQPQQFGAQPQQFGAQPQQFGAQQPVYAAPVYGQPVAVKKKVVPLVIGACAAAVVAFLIVLFTVIIPNNSGVKGQLRHKWSNNDSGITIIYDFKKSEMSGGGGLLTIPFDWELTGDDTLKMEVSMLGQSEDIEYKFSISEDGKTLTLTSVDYPSQKQVFKRAD